MKSRMIAAALGVAVMLVTSVASAEEQCATGTTFVAIEAQADAPDAGSGIAAATDEAAGLGSAPDFEPLTDDELTVLTEAAARNPELEEKAGGYVSNEQLVGILVVVLIVVIVL